MFTEKLEFFPQTFIQEPARHQGESYFLSGFRLTENTGLDLARSACSNRKMVPK